MYDSASESGELHVSVPVASNGDHAITLQQLLEVECYFSNPPRLPSFSGS